MSDFDFIGQNSKRGAIRLFIGCRDFLSHITTSGEGRTNQVVIDEVNQVVRRRNAALFVTQEQLDYGRLRTLRPTGTRYNAANTIKSKRKDIIPMGNEKDSESLGPAWTTLENQLWDWFTKDEIIDAMRAELPHRVIKRSLDKHSLSQEWVKYGNPREHEQYKRGLRQELQEGLDMLDAWAAVQ